MKLGISVVRSCAKVCDVCVCLCVRGFMYSCVCIWFLAESIEFGASLEQLGNVCVVPLSKRFSHKFGAFLKRLWSRDTCKLALNWLGTATRSRKESQMTQYVGRSWLNSKIEKCRKMDSNF